ncbi:MAG TPA: lamin tail domain-containing protein [Candidatus Paceibacterota bacterium]
MIIKKFLPNPIGKDTKGEYITIANDEQETINLTGWQVKDASGKIFKLNGYALKANEELKLPYSKTKISLNNDAETVYLIDAKGKIADELSYAGSAAEGRIISRDIVANQELKNELLENPPEPPAVINSNPPMTAFFILLFLTGVILSGLSVWILNKTNLHETSRT